MSTSIIPREERLGVRTWIEIDKKAIANNYAVFRSLLNSKIKLLSVVKSNAYGHGLVDFSKEVERLGVDWLAVDSIVEALKLRKEGIKIPILVLGYTLPERMQDAVQNNISVTVSNMFALEGIHNLGLRGKIRVHIKVDSGMHRQGFLENDRQKVLEFIAYHKDEIQVEGLYTHFAAAKDPERKDETQDQKNVFDQWILEFQQAGIKPLTHAAATGATIVFPDTHYDMVRVGIGLHGLWPSSEIQAHYASTLKLKPTLAWKTIVSEIKTIPAGAKIGYDFTHAVTRDTKMAVCPIGYWHGYSRSLSNKGAVLVDGIRADVLGRVSMDMLVIDVTDVSGVQMGDEVVLIGKSGDDNLSAHDVANLASVSTYEFVTRINPLIKKIYF